MYSWLCSSVLIEAVRRPIVSLGEMVVRPILPSEEGEYHDLMEAHHYLGFLPKIGETVWYVASFQDRWVALLSFSAAAWKCKARDQWIGWSFRHQYDRLKLVANNSRFLILPDWHVRNVGSHVLSLCRRRLPRDWQERFGHPVLLLETFVDPLRFQGTVYKADNWCYIGNTRGFRRTPKGYVPSESPKMVFVKPMAGNARALLSGAALDPAYRKGGPKIMLGADSMQSLPSFFFDIPDPRRREGRRHRLSTVLAIAAGATLCGMRGYKAIATWAESLGQKARRRFGCRFENGSYLVPSESIIRNVLIRIDPVHLDHALQQWNDAYGTKDESLAIDGKTMCNAIDDKGQVHVMSVVGHETRTCYTQKK
jgi:uncharacterized protein DUF4338/DDE family transposase